MKWIQRSTVLVAIGLLLAGCSGLPLNAEKPRITLAGINIVDIGVVEQRFNLQLRIQNPNDFVLPVNALSYELEINDLPFASGVSNRGVTIQRFSSELMQVEAVSNINALIRQFRSFEKGSRVKYRLKGFANVLNNNRMPFNQSGEVELPAAIFP